MATDSDSAHGSSVLVPARVTACAVYDRVNIYNATPRHTALLDTESGKELVLPVATKLDMRSGSTSTLFNMGHRLVFSASDWTGAPREACARSAAAAQRGRVTDASACAAACDLVHLAAHQCPVGYVRLDTSHERHAEQCLDGRPAGLNGFPEGGAVFSSSPRVAGILLLRKASPQVVEGKATCAEVNAFQRLRDPKDHACARVHGVAPARFCVTRCRTGTVSAATLEERNGTVAQKEKSMHRSFLRLACIQLYLAVRQQWYYNKETATYVFVVHPHALQVDECAMLPFLAVAFGLVVDAGRAPPAIRWVAMAAVSTLTKGGRPRRSADAIYDLDVEACKAVSIRTFIALVSQRLFYWGAPGAWFAENEARLRGWVRVPLKEEDVDYSDDEEDGSGKGRSGYGASAFARADVATVPGSYYVETDKATSYASAPRQSKQFWENFGFVICAVRPYDQELMCRRVVPEDRAEWATKASGIFNQDFPSTLLNVDAWSYKTHFFFSPTAPPVSLVNTLRRGRVELQEHAPRTVSDATVRVLAAMHAYVMSPCSSAKIVREVVPARANGGRGGKARSARPRAAAWKMEVDSDDDGCDDDGGGGGMSSAMGRDACEAAELDDMDGRNEVYSGSLRHYTSSSTRGGAQETRIQLAMTGAMTKAPRRKKAPRRPDALAQVIARYGPATAEAMALYCSTANSVFPVRPTDMCMLRLAQPRRCQSTAFRWVVPVMWPVSLLASPTRRSEMNLYHPWEQNPVRLCHEWLRDLAVFDDHGARAIRLAVTVRELEQLEGVRAVGVLPPGVGLGDREVPLPMNVLHDFMVIRELVRREKRVFDGYLGEDCNFLVTGTRADVAWVAYLAMSTGLAMDRILLVLLWLEWVRRVRPSWAGSDTRDWFTRNKAEYLHGDFEECADGITRMKGSVTATSSAVKTEAVAKDGSAAVAPATAAAPAAYASASSVHPVGEAGYLRFSTSDRWGDVDVVPVMVQGDAFQRATDATRLARLERDCVSSDAFIPSALDGKTLPPNLTMFPLAPDVVAELLRGMGDAWNAALVCLYKSGSTGAGDSVVSERFDNYACRLITGAGSGEMDAFCCEALDPSVFAPSAPRQCGEDARRFAESALQRFALKSVASMTAVLAVHNAAVTFVDHRVPLRRVLVLGAPLPDHLRTRHATVVTGSTACEDAMPAVPRASGDGGGALDAIVLDESGFIDLGLDDIVADAEEDAATGAQPFQLLTADGLIDLRLDEEEDDDAGRAPVPAPVPVLAEMAAAEAKKDKKKTQKKTEERQRKATAKRARTGNTGGAKGSGKKVVAGKEGATKKRRKDDGVAESREQSSSSAPGPRPVLAWNYVRDGSVEMANMLDAHEKRVRAWTKAREAHEARLPSGRGARDETAATDGDRRMFTSFVRALVCGALVTLPPELAVDAADVRDASLSARREEAARCGVPIDKLRDPADFEVLDLATGGTVDLAALLDWVIGSVATVIAMLGYWVYRPPASPPIPANVGMPAGMVSVYAPQSTWWPSSWFDSPERMALRRTGAYISRRLRVAYEQISETLARVRSTDPRRTTAQLCGGDEMAELALSAFAMCPRSFARAARPGSGGGGGGGGSGGGGGGGGGGSGGHAGKAGSSRVPRSGQLRITEGKGTETRDETAAYAFETVLSYVRANLSHGIARRNGEALPRADKRTTTVAAIASREYEGMTATDVDHAAATSFEIAVPSATCPVIKQVRDVSAWMRTVRRLLVSRQSDCDMRQLAVVYAIMEGLGYNGNGIVRADAATMQKALAHAATEAGEADGVQCLVPPWAEHSAVAEVLEAALLFAYAQSVGTEQGALLLAFVRSFASICLQNKAAPNISRLYVYPPPVTGRRSSRLLACVRVLCIHLQGEGSMCIAPEKVRLEADAAAANEPCSFVARARRLISVCSAQAPRPSSIVGLSGNDDADPAAGADADDAEFGIGRVIAQYNQEMDKDIDQVLGLMCHTGTLDETGLLGATVCDLPGASENAMGYEAGWATDWYTPQGNDGDEAHVNIADIL